jgi:cytochrome c biogenesis protein CcmG/thiol:disulfide interchange protein DsbE
MDADRSTPETTESRSRWLSTVVWVLAALLLVGMVCALVLQMSEGSRSRNLAASIALGKRPAAPALPTKAMISDQHGRLVGYDPKFAGTSKAFPGRIMVVNFWASWCGPCREEAPELNAIAGKRAGDGVVVVGVYAASEDAWEDARDFVQEYKLDFPIVRGTRSQVNEWGVRGYPETFVVGRDGKIAAHIDGPLDADALASTLDQEIARKSAVGQDGEPAKKAQTSQAASFSAEKLTEPGSLTPVPAGERMTTLDAISKLVVCPSCDAPLERSDSPSADRMRVWIKRRVDAGWTKSQILDGVVEAYGGDSAVLAAPRADGGRGMIAWLVPGVIAALALLFGLFRLRKSGRRFRSTASS